MRFNPAGMMIMLALLLVPAFPYGLQYAPGSNKPLKWKADRITLTVSESLLAKDAIRGDADAVAIMRRAAAAWSSAGAPQFEIEFSSDVSVSPSGHRGDGVSLLTIAATPENLLLFAGGTVPKPAVTRLFYDRDGSITEADIVLNPYFSHSTNGLPGSFDLESTLVHEFGHLLGLGHSSLPGASMFEFNGRNGLYGSPFSMFRTLSADDKAGIRTLYGDDRDASVIEGTAASGFGDGPVLVWGESVESGSVEGAVLTDKEQRFRLSGLGDIALRVYARNESTGRSVALGTFYQGGWLSQSLPSEGKGEEQRVTILGAGVNGELSGLAVPLANGSTYRVYAAVSDFPEPMRFRTSSPGLVVDDSSYEVFDYGDGVTVVSFLLSVGSKVPEGLYSLRVVYRDRVVDSFPGVISIGTDTNPFVHHDVVDRP